MGSPAAPVARPRRRGRRPQDGQGDGARGRHAGGHAREDDTEAGGPALDGAWQDEAAALDGDLLDDTLPAPLAGGPDRAQPGWPRYLRRMDADAPATGSEAASARDGQDAGDARAAQAANTPAAPGQPAPRPDRPAPAVVPVPSGPRRTDPAQRAAVATRPPPPKLPMPAAFAHAPRGKEPVQAPRAATALLARGEAGARDAQAAADRQQGAAQRALAAQAPHGPDGGAGEAGHQGAHKDQNGAQDAKDKKGGAGAAGHQGAAQRGAGGKSEGGDGAAVALIETLEAPAADDTDLGWQPLRAPDIAPSWPVADALPADALPSATATAAKPASGAAAAPASPNAAPGNPPGPAQPAAPGQAATPDASADAHKAERQAQDIARQSYQGLARAARQLQDGFTRRASRTGDDLLAAYDLAGRTLQRRHEDDLAHADAEAEAARQAVNAAADLAQQRLELAAARAARSITTASGQAEGAISAGERRNAQQVDAAVAGLVQGHTQAYDEAIAKADKAFKAAVEALDGLSANPGAEFPLGQGDALASAKNESVQARVPRWVQPEKKRLDDRLKEKKTAWTGSRDETACSLSCTYRAALKGEIARMAREARAAMARSLAQARCKLRQQKEDGSSALAGQRQAALQQVATQQRAARARLASQNRGFMRAVRGEAQAALGGVGASARAALPTFWRAAQGYESAVRKAAPNGAQALRPVAERGAQPPLASLRQSAQALEGRLGESAQKLPASLAQHGATQAQAGQAAGETLAATLQALGQQAGQRMGQAVEGLEASFTTLDDTVRDAGKGWSAPLDKHLGPFLARQKADAAAKLQALRSGGSGAGGGNGAPAAAGGAGAGGAAGAAAPALPGPGGAAAASAGAAAAAAAGGGSDTPAPDCACGGKGQGASPAGPGAANAGAGPAGPAQGGDAPKGLDGQVQAEETFYAARSKPKEFFKEQVGSTGGDVETSLRNKVRSVYQAFEGGWAGTVDEAGVVGALRGLSAYKGRALEEVMYGRSLPGHILDVDLRRALGPKSGEYGAARAYLSGDHLAGARFELRDSVGIFNDDEARIEAVLRALPPDELKALGQDASLRRDVGEALGGTDRQVFDALLQGDHALADAWRMRDAVDEARRDGKPVAALIERYTGAPDEGDWRATQEMTGDARRAAVVQALGGIVADADVAYAAGSGGVAAMSATDRAVAWVTRDIQVQVGGGDMPPQTVTLRVEGAQRDLAVALLRHGANSTEARVARLGVELQKGGEPPDPLQMDRALYDERFMPDRPGATREEREANEAARRAARLDRQRLLLLAAQAYTPGAAGGAGAGAPLDPQAVMKPGFQPDQAQVQASQDALVQRMNERFGSDTVGASLARGLLTEERPSADTVALAMRHATLERSGTNEELLFRFTERMTRDEIADMRKAFRRQTGQELDAVLGTFQGGDVLPELSGDDRLRMERALRGVARTDQERLEAAAFALQQQRREAGGLGAALAEGTMADQAMGAYERQVQWLAGGPVAFNARGELIGKLPNFDATTGAYTGRDQDNFAGVVNTAQSVADAYSARIDAFADVATTGIAILGAVAAAVITVATGGAAGPLIAAAVLTGLASMSANYALKGGRYGWEQAAVDLGMTAVQAVTAGVGAQLGAAAQVASKGAAAAGTASRTLLSLSRLFTGNPVVDQIVIGALTGSLGGLSGAAFDERTWEKGGADAVGALFTGLIRGALAGGATATLSQSVEALGRNGAAIAERARALAAQGGVLRTVVGTAGRGVGALGQGLDKALNASAGGGLGSTVSAVARRSLARGAISSLGAMGGRGAELAVDSASGHFKGDAGDALLQMGQAGLHAFVQGLGEGGGEAFGQARHGRALAQLSDAIAAERASQGLQPLSPHDLEAAAADLLHMNHVSEGDALSREVNLQHVAENGGLHPAPGAAAAAAHPAADAEGQAAPPRAAGTEPAPAEAATPARPAHTEAEGAAPRPHEDEAPRRPATEETHAPAQPRAVGEEHPSAAPRTAGADAEAEQAALAAAQALAAAGGPPRHGGEGEGGGPRRGGGGGGGEESDRLFPNLRQEEIDAAFAAAEAGPLVRVEGHQPGADVRPLRPGEPGEPSLPQRQRAGALHEEAQRTQAQAEERLARAVQRDAEADLADSHNPRRARRLRQEANELLAEAAALETQAARLRAESQEFASGRRSATADLPGPEDVDALFARLEAEGPGLVQVPLSDVERNPALLPRLLRPLLEGEGGGRLVFRVESERSRKLVRVDAQGNVTIEGGASAHLNFGSFERAVEFVLNNSEGQARIYSFEVDEAWVRSVRSAGMPEHGTGDLHGQPRVVDVRFADDQLEIPAPLIGELNRFIVPGSGKVHEIPRPGAPSGGSGGHGGGGDGGPGPSAGAGHAPATADEVHAARLLRGEGEAEAAPPARPAGADEATAPARSGPAAEAAAPRATGTEPSTTAAAVPGSDFHGEGKAGVVTRGKNAASATPEALQRLQGPGGQFEGLLRPGKRDPSKLLLSRHGGGELEVEVRIGTVSRSGGDRDGPLPVASYEKNGDRVVITVSGKASPAQVQRALAHELGELRFVSHDRSDLLQPGVHPDTLPAAAKGALSRHDRGRMAEVEHLAREIDAARARGDHRAAAQLQDEAGRLVAHMGLVHGGEAADARRALALSALEPGSAGQRLLGDMVSAARVNPMLEAPLGTLDDLSLLARQSAYQQGLGLGDQRQVRAAAARVVEEGLVRSGGRTVDGEAIAQARERLPDEASRALLDRAVEHARLNGRDVERDLALAATARPDPLQQELARQRFGDHPNFQDFAEFKARYLKTHPSLDGGDAALQQGLFQVWAGGAFVTAQGGIRGIAVGAIRAVPTDVNTHGLSLAGDAAQVQRAADQAHAMDTLERTLQEMAGKGKPSGRTPEQMAQDLYDARIAVRDLGEALGESAAGHFAQQHLNLNTPPLPCSRKGAGVPDLAYRAADGRLILIEAKGPQAGLQFRRTADGRLAEQGTPQYLESLARDMMRPTSPADVQALGHQILVALRTSPPNIDYYVVRQPLDKQQRPTALEAQKFDLGSGRATPNPTTAATTASPATLPTP